MKKIHHQKESTKWNKLTSLLIMVLCGLAFMVDGDLTATATAIMLPIALVLFFVKEPIVGRHKEDDYPWGGKK